MGETKSTSTSTTGGGAEDPSEDSPPQAPSPPPPPPPSLGKPHVSSLVEPHQKKKQKRVFRVFRSVLRSFPIMTPMCKFPIIHTTWLPDGGGRTVTGSRVTGTLFGYRKGRVSLSIQEAPKCLPTLVLELAMQTFVLQKEMSSGMVRIALECEKRSSSSSSSDNNTTTTTKLDQKMRLLDEPLWTMYCNGKKSGYGVKRDATEEDLNIMELLKPVSMGAGVLPSAADAVDGPDSELAYMRAHFERVVGSKDSETLYMLSPDGNNGPELSIFFVRI